MIGFLVTVGMFVVVLGGIVWLARRARAGKGGASILGPIQDMWDPTVYREQLRFEQQVQRRVEGEQPGEPPWWRGKRR
ncbi:hypothetical protein [Actinophytocola sp.]|uniref:hypothetical protein n=1 Tax=Actinophytocola sp. TaxID=1872138 RepID=UPI002DB6210C|nr:hypothetical protein [Actinophytocola sp.]